MKYLLLLASCLALLSCKKEYSCACTQVVTVPAYVYNDQFYPQQLSTYTFVNTFKSKAKDAEANCAMGESVQMYPSTYAAYGQGQTVEVVACELQ
jgi:hypothetical protein